MNAVYDLATGVASALGDGWSAESRHDYAAVVRHADGRGLFLYRPTHPWSARGRVRVTGLYPEGFHARSGEELEITVSVARDPRAVARDIQRRFLPRYEALLPAAMERCAEQDRADARREGVAAAVMAAVPGSQLEAGWSVPVVALGQPFGWGSKVRTGYDAETVTLQLSDLPADTAVEVVRMLAAAFTDVQAQHDAGRPAAAVRRGLRLLPRWRRPAAA